MKRRIKLATVLAAGAIALSACGGSTGLTALDREATPEDALPADVKFSPKADPGSVRLLATDNGLKFFAAQDADQRTACLAVVAADSSDGWVASCSDLRSQGKIVNMSSTPLEISAALVADGNDAQLMESDGWTRIHENVFVKRWDAP